MIIVDLIFSQKKALPAALEACRGFCFAGKRSEPLARRSQISNLDLKAEIGSILDLEEIFSSTLFRFDQVVTKPNHK